MSVEFGAGINVLTGNNGIGKTNLLDAIHFLAFTKGFRSNKDKQAILKGADFFMIKGTVLQGEKELEIQCNFTQAKGKRVLVNGSAASKMSDHIGQLPLVVSLPGDTLLINDAAAERRRFMDMLIAQYSPLYLQHLIGYNKVLQQRNALLKQFQEQRFFDADLLAVWDQQLIPHGRELYKARATFMVEFAPIFTRFFHQIVSADETPEIRYRSPVKENSETGWQDMLLEAQARDRANLYSGTGVHRDDLVFTINGQSARHFGSQGQQKTFVIALRLAQYALLADHHDQAPIFLLDDLFEKLDTHRLAQLAEVLDQTIEGQVFITDTTRARISDLLAQVSEKEVRYFEVTEGDVAQV